MNIYTLHTIETPDGVAVQALHNGTIVYTIEYQWDANDGFVPVSNESYTSPSGPPAELYTQMDAHASYGLRAKDNTVEIDEG